MHPDLVNVTVTSPAYDAALARLRSTESALTGARQRELDAGARLGELRSAELDLVTQIGVADRRRAKSEGRLVEVREGVRQLALAAYVRGGAVVDSGLDLRTADDTLSSEMLVEVVGTQRFADLRTNEAVAAETTALIDRQTPVLAAVRDEIEATEAARVAAIEDGARAQEQLGTDRQAVADARLTAGVVGLDLPLIVLDAYYRAALTFAAEQPDCGLRWQSLAGIGKTESKHGSYLGSSVGPDGVVDPPIRGIPLDGSRGTAVVGDSDGGELDDDPGVDRAVGPMQFIPAAWRELGRDGNGDETADPDNIYDAALAAANLLCRQGPGLDADEGLQRAYFSYNRSEEYVRIVLERTHEYDAYTIPS